MATSAQVDAAAGYSRRSGPSPTFMDSSSVHVTACPRADEDAERAERRRAARALVRLGRTPEDPAADLLLEMCGLSHDDAAPVMDQHLMKEQTA